MNSSIVATIDFTMRALRGDEILRMVTRVANLEQLLYPAYRVFETSDTDFQIFQTGLWSRFEHANVMVAPSTDQTFFNAYNDYDQLIITPHVWYQELVVRQEYPFHTTEDQLIDRVNNLAQALAEDDPYESAVIKDVPFRYKPSLPATLF